VSQVGGYGPAMQHRVVGFRLIVATALVACALAACGSSSNSHAGTSSALQGDAGEGVGSGHKGATSTGYGYNGSSNGNVDSTGNVTTIPGTTAPTTPASGLARAVADHLASVHHRTDVASVTGDATTGVVIHTTLPASDASAGREICDEAAMVAGDAAMTIAASDGSRLAGRSQGGACA
jgi:hypothetical protein